MSENAPMGTTAHPDLRELEVLALSFPGAWADEPWGDYAVKVGKKIFVFLSGPDSTEPAITVKVPESRDHALSYPEAFPTGYGLGKHGWVTLLVEESCRAVAT